MPADKAPFWNLDILAGLMLILLVVALVFDNINTNTLRVISAQNVLLSERTAQARAVADRPARYPGPAWCSARRWPAWASSRLAWPTKSKIRSISSTTSPKSPPSLAAEIKEAQAAGDAAEVIALADDLEKPGQNPAPRAAGGGHC
ncbi:hypothetical protein ACFQT0_09085 [Hymenobacter humi]|uniref:DUF21 domain-containing protein n=1 Tax=Hymenobacter humi TaxID=1411620 RepID=A0ABW2U230_9BACT